MLTLLFHVCAVSSVSAFVVGGRVFTPNLRGSTVSMAAVPKGMKAGQDYDADYLKKERKIKLGSNFQSKWFGQTRFEDKEEKRRNKLITGTNWAPRTYPKKGEGYFFFQGPTPKTAYQEDLPSFFSAENFASMQIKPIQIWLTITGFISFATLTALLVAPQGISPPALNLQVATPDVLKAKKDAPAKKDPAAEKAAAEKAAAAKKATADKAAADKAAAKKAAAEKKAAADKAAAAAKKDPAAKKAAAEKAAADKAASTKAAAEKAAAEKAAAEKAAAEKAAAEKAAKEKAAAEAAEAAKTAEQKAAEAKAKAEKAAAEKAVAEKAAAEKAADAKIAKQTGLGAEARALDPRIANDPTADDLRAIIAKSKQKKF